MAKVNALFEVICPCCDTVLKIDPETQSVISHQQPTKRPLIDDLSVAVQRLKGEAGRLEDEFQKNVARQKSHGKVMETKFDELLRQAKENPDAGPPKRDFDLD